MSATCLVTGGAGFIGCAVSRHLAERFDRVVAFDSLHPQVHARRVRPPALDSRVELVIGDVTQAEDWQRLLTGIQPATVIHLAAETGTAQSLTESSRHAAVNVLGTTLMLDALAQQAHLPHQILLTSSRAVYGEGAWVDGEGTIRYPGQRSHRMLESGSWDFPGLTPLPADAARDHPQPTSVYGATKLAQEHIVRSWCLSMGTAPLVLRLQNVYGPGQSLSNPYTGIVPLFAQVARSAGAIPLYEDGKITRDFVYIDDVARAVVAATALDSPITTAIDIGSGSPSTISELAVMVARHYAAPGPEVTGAFRDGDVRHAACSVDDAQNHLGWRAEVELEDGVERLCGWLDRIAV